MSGKRELPRRTAGGGNSLFAPSAERARGATKRRISKSGLIAIVITAALLFWIPLELHLSNNAPGTETVTVRSNRLPEAFDGFRIVQLSDLHQKTFGKDNETLLGLVRDAKPDMIALTGDLIDSVEAFSYAVELLPKLTAIAPVYYVTGNHEWSADGKTAYMGRNRLITRLEDAVTESGGVWLDSSFCTLERGGERIILAGLCDPNGPRTEPNVHELRQMIEREQDAELFSLLLSHRHDIDYTHSGFDVVLSGHAHGGVIRLPFTDGLRGPAREWFPKGTSGLLRQGDTQVVVSRGLGDTYFPRFLNRPQVVVVVLSCQEGK
ncbi:MAG: metallophosphoesterase [Oscillospiraceae bacterium]|nr:metallophosphoesterase [Oscillospiraceae bacterium]